VGDDVRAVDDCAAVVDRPKMVADTRAAYAADKEKKIAAAKRSLGGTSAPAPQAVPMDENALMDALAAAETRGDQAEVDRLTKLVEEVIADSR